MILRWLKFNAVGAAGLLVQTGALAALAGAFALHYALATAIAVELALLHNFFWHERFTWRDRRGGSAGARLLRFQLTTGALSLGGNLLLMALLTGALGVHYLAANLVTIALLALANFTVSNAFVFRPPIPAEPAPPCSCLRACRKSGKPARPRSAPNR